MPQTSVVDLNDVGEGEVQSTAELSQLLQLYGGFPSSLFVRQEVKMVWGILCNNYIGSSPPNNAYVLVGSPGVGKSALLVLFCCYLATHHDYNIYLARSLKHAGRTSSPHVLLCFRGKEVTAYPDCRPHHMEALWATFRTEHVHNLKFLIVGDGYRQANFESGQLDFFNTCNLLSTSAQYRLTEDSNHKLLGVPAWSFQSIQAMARAFGTLEVDELYAYSGGSVRAFTRDPFDLKMRTILQCNSVTAHTSVALRECISGLLDQGIDIMRRLFICNVNREESYVNPNRWLYCVDSTIVLKELAAKATLESFVNNGRDFAIEINNTDYVQTLKELLVQQMEYTVHPDDLKLILAKNDDDNWLQQNSGVVEALKRGVATNVVKKVLAKPQMIGSYEIRALGVPTEGSRGNIHVLVVVPPKEWGDVRPSKAREGEVQSTAELSQLLQLYG
ncbi:hypothetical protein DYB36_013540, partial [Aphanomyces astaci]